MVRVENKAACFKTLRQLMLELHLHFNMRALEACVTTEMVDRAMDEVEKGMAANRGTVGPSGEGATVETTEVGRAKSTETS